MIKKIMWLIVFLSVSLFADIKSVVNKNEITRGEEVVFSLIANGNNVQFPNINKIDGYQIEGTQSSQSISIVNANTTREISRSYIFTPLKSITIPSYSVKVDGKIEKSKPIKIKVVKFSSTPASSNFSLKMTVNKKNVYVGEPIVLNIIFKQKRDINIGGIQFTQPDFSNFWVKSSGKDNKQIIGDYIVHDLKFVLVPQQAGHIKIPASKVSIAKIVQNGDPFLPMFQSLKWTNLYSNELNINVKPLPSNISVYGNFSITDKVDKTKVKANTPVNLTLTIKGDGNIDGINNFKLKIPNITIYGDNPKRNMHFKNGEYKGSFTQKFALISNNDFTIPAIKFSFFDEITKKIKTIETKPIKIKVISSSSQVLKHQLIENNNTQQNQKTVKIVYKNKNSYEKWIYFIVGLFLGSILMFLLKEIKFSIKKEEKELSLANKIRKSKNDKELLKILLPYENNYEIKNIIKMIEENIYMNKNNKIDKKELSKNIENILNPKEDDF